MAEISLNDQIIEELFRDSQNVVSCPYIRKDSTGPYCGKNFIEGSKIEETRRMICDIFSLNEWCLTPNHERCAYFQGEEI